MHVYPAKQTLSMFIFGLMFVLLLYLLPSSLLCDNIYIGHEFILFLCAGPIVIKFCTIKWYMTCSSKNETMNSPIHQFTNLKCGIKAREPFKIAFNSVLVLTLKKHFKPCFFILKTLCSTLNLFNFFEHLNFFPLIVINFHPKQILSVINFFWTTIMCLLG